MLINRNETLRPLPTQEDTDGSRTITIDDAGPKRYTVHGANGETLEVKGTHHLANLLQEVWLAEHLAVALDEYQNVWMNPHTHYFAHIGLNRHFDEGRGRPKETEPGHFDFILQHHAQKHGMSPEALMRAYDAGYLRDEALDRYFVHDRAMHESGHDTTRLDDMCADTACVDLNAILYRVETDIAALLADHAPQGFQHNSQTHTAAGWQAKAQARREAVEQYLWNGEDGTFYDYNVEKKAQNCFVSATNLLPLWAGLCSQTQAERTVKSQLGILLYAGGIASTAPSPPEPPAPNANGTTPTAGHRTKS